MLKIMNNLKEGDLCRKCKTLLIVKETKKRNKPRKTKYYYTHYFYCPNCKRMYLSDEFKIFVKKEEKTQLQIRYEFLVKEFKENGFTKQQAEYLIKLLNDLIPLV